MGITPGRTRINTLREPRGQPRRGRGRRDRQPLTDQVDSPDRTAPKLANEQAESTEASDQTEPIDRIEPADPMDRIEPVEPMDKMDPLEPMLRIDPAGSGCAALFPLPMAPLSQQRTG